MLHARTKEFCNKHVEFTEKIDADFAYAANNHIRRTFLFMGDGFDVIVLVLAQFVVPTADVPAKLPTPRPRLPPDCRVPPTTSVTKIVCTNQYVLNSLFVSLRVVDHDSSRLSPTAQFKDSPGKFSKSKLTRSLPEDCQRTRGLG